MDFGSSAMAVQAAPLPVADTRPSADTAALVKARAPDIAFAAPPAAPPSLSQSASVSRSMMLATGVEPAEKTRATGSGAEAQRTLKPYGIAMLPDTEKASEAQTAKADEADGTEEPEG